MLCIAPRIKTYGGMISIAECQMQMIVSDKVVITSKCGEVWRSRVT